MSLVPFAGVCDQCGARGPEYEIGFLGVCVDCGAEVCHDRCVSKIIQEGEGTIDRVRCRWCAAEETPK
jgi:predicted amidophosphoribosyltransferase